MEHLVHLCVWHQFSWRYLIPSSTFKCFLINNFPFGHYLSKRKIKFYDQIEVWKFDWVPPSNTAT